jgi:hypothetical protein
MIVELSIIDTRLKELDECRNFDQSYFTKQLQVNFLKQPLKLTMHTQTYEGEYLPTKETGPAVSASHQEPQTSAQEPNSPTQEASDILFKDTPTYSSMRDQQIEKMNLGVDGTSETSSIVSLVY